jgi:putative peptide zinc metalloprotease protein
MAVREGSAFLPTRPRWPHRPDRLELIGEFQGSGFREPTYLVRRSDGQVIRLSALLYQLALGANGRRDLAALARWVAPRAGARLSAEDVRFLIEEKLLPAGVIESAPWATAEIERAEPVLGLRARIGVVRPHVAQAIARLFSPLFLPPVLVVLLSAFLAVDVWLVLSHGVLDSLIHVAQSPAALLAVAGLTVLGTVFHECGHVAACRYGGARPGRMGFGLYLVWPALYADLTDAYRLDRAGRLRTDLGGVYFNLVFVVVLGAAWLATGFEALVVAIVLQHYQVLFQLVPVVRFDGHYIVSDLTGVPDVLSRVGPALRSLVPGTRSDHGMQELRPYARWVLWVYVVVTTLALTTAVAVLLGQLPRLVAAAAGRADFEVARLVAGLTEPDPVVGLLGLISLAALTLPLAGTAVTLVLVGKRLAGAARERNMRPRDLVWPESGRNATVLAWNSLFAMAALLSLTTLVLVGYATAFA